MKVSLNLLPQGNYCELTDVHSPGFFFFACMAWPPEFHFLLCGTSCCQKQLHEKRLYFLAILASRCGHVYSCCHWNVSGKTWYHFWAKALRQWVWLFHTPVLLLPVEAPGMAEPQNKRPLSLWITEGKRATCQTTFNLCEWEMNFSYVWVFIRVGPYLLQQLTVP